ncbi:MAG: DUF4838 domain-containing protein [Armatimonadota bacterium]
MRVFPFITAALFLTAAAVQASADIELVKDGRTKYCIVLAKDASPSEHWAASELKLFMRQMSGVVLSYAPDGENVPEKAILLGNCEALKSLGVNIDFNDLGDEGFIIKTVGDRIVIAGGKLRGTMYGVHSFLESLGCRFLTNTVNKVPKKSDITLGNIDTKEKPAFEYREVLIREAMQPDYAARNRCNSNSAGLDAKRGLGVFYYPFVHSFYQLVPGEIYWDTHPEYYSMVKGERVKQPTQLCMSNPEVVKIATQTVLDWMRDHPEAKIYSVSQNDCQNRCECPACKAIEEEEGSPSGLLLRFVNAIAAETAKVYPDKLVDTLAYMWTEKPCKITKPLPNVRVRLCPIYCCEAHPYETCDFKSNVDYMDNLKAWSQITNNLYIWHYNTDFSHYLMPFPDYRQLMDTAKLYKKYGVKGIFWEGNYNGGISELGELRSYLLAKISWNPDIDGDAVMREFCDDYYGKSGKYIYEYIQTLEDKVTNDNIHMRIWSDPNSQYVSPDIIAKLDTIMNSAIAVADSPDILYRVKQACLPLKYVKLMQPIMRKEIKGNKTEYEKKVDEFIEECSSFGVTRINEWRPNDKWVADTKALINKQ